MRSSETNQTVIVIALLLNDTAIDFPGRVAGPHIAIGIGDPASAFRHGHVAVDHGRLNRHTDRRIRIRNDLSPRQIGARSGNHLVIHDRVVVSPIENHDSADKRRGDPAVPLGSRGSIGVIQIPLN